MISILEGETEAQSSKSVPEFMNFIELSTCQAHDRLFTHELIQTSKHNHKDTVFLRYNTSAELGS